MLHAQTSTPPTKHVQFKFFIIPIWRGVESYGHCAQRSHPAYTPMTSQSTSRNLPLAQVRASCFRLCTIKPSLSSESPDCPSLRASDEHRFIVRVLRARRMVWRLPSPLLRPRVARAQES